VKERFVASISSQKSLSARVNNRKKKMKSITKLAIGIAAVGVAAVTSLQASITIDYNVDGVAPIQFGGAYAGDPQHDTATIQAYSGSGLFLPDNTPTTAKINNLNLVIYYTTVQGNWTVPANRNMTITVPSGGTQILSQNLTVDSWLSNYPNDTVWALAGTPTATFNILGLGTVAVTPLAEGPFIHENGEFNHDLRATFLFTPVPEPTTMIAGAMLLLPFGLSTIRMLRKSRTA
jgi:hypothetical protein